MNSDVAVNSVQIPLGVLIVLMICVAMISGMIWYNIGKAHNSPNRNEVLYKAFINMDNYVIVVALLLLIFSIGLSITGIEQNLAIVILNVFSSVVFSWLLTKKTSIKDFKYIQGGINTCKMDWFDLLSEEEQDNQKRSEHNPNDYGTVDTVIRNEEINQEDA